MTLNQAGVGRAVRILRIPDPRVRTQAIRFGIHEGSKVVLEERIPGGPVVVRSRFQEIALGKRLAEAIEVEPAEMETAE